MFFLMLLLMAIVPGMSSGTVAKAAENVPDAPGSVSGYVRDRKGNPLKDIKVTLFSNEFFRSFYSDHSGFYKFPLLPPDEYIVGFNYLDSYEYLTQLYPDSTTIEGATKLQIAGDNLENINVTLTLASKITGTVSFSGTVITSSNTGYVYAYQFDSKTLTWVQRGNGVPTIEGQYILGGLSAGTYRVCAVINWTGEPFRKTACFGDSPYVSKAQDIVVGEEAVQTGVDIVFQDYPDAATISGSVMDTSGNPISGTVVTVYPYSYNDPLLWNDYIATTDQNGRYEIGSLIPDVVSYTVYFYDSSGNHIIEYYDNQTNIDSATKFTPHARQTISNVNAVLEKAAHISGTITLQGEAPYLEGIVNLWRKADSEWQNVASGSIDKTSGNYHFPGLSAGAYRVCAAYYYVNYESIGSCFGGKNRDDALDVSLSVGEIRNNTNFDISTKMYDGSISGKVNANGMPLSGINVELLKINNSQALCDANNLTERSAAHIDNLFRTTDAQGHYRFEGLSPGYYNLKVTDPLFYYATTFYEQLLDRPLYSSLSIDCGQARENIDIQMSIAGAITGKITIASGIPLSNTEISLLWASGFDYLRKAAFTNAQGVYLIRGVQPGNYWLQAYSSVNVYPDGGYAEFYGDPSYSSPQSRTITVTSGITTTEIDIILGPDNIVWLPVISRE